MTEEDIFLSPRTIFDIRLDKLLSRVLQVEEECHSEIKRKDDRIRELGEGIRKVLSSRIWGHQHWDASGRCGAGCEICQEQFKVRKELYELVEGGEKDEVSKL